MLNPIAQRWVAKLRSGDTKQGKSRLRNKKDERCCLGVLCDLAVEDGVIPAPTLNGYAYEYGLPNRMTQKTLPAPVKEWAGLNYVTGQFTGGYLTEQNDAGATFAEIADLIESMPPGLFVDRRNED